MRNGEEHTHSTIVSKKRFIVGVVVPGVVVYPYQHMIKLAELA